MALIEIFFHLGQTQLDLWLEFLLSKKYRVTIRDKTHRYREEKVQLCIIYINSKQSVNT